MTLDQITNELAAVEEQIKPLLRRSAELKREKRKLESQAFIKANGVTLDDVELMSGEGKPWFGMLSEMAAWMRKTKSTKRFCEWNGIILFSAEVLNGNFDLNAPGRTVDLKSCSL